jgi:hypothetical protein
MAGVIALAPTPNGFTVSQLARQVRTILGLEADQYLPRHASYDLKKLRGKHWVHKIENSRRYQPDPQGLMNMTALLTLRDKVIKPVLAGVGQPQQDRKPNRSSALDLQYGKVQSELHSLFNLLGIAIC